MTTLSQLIVSYTVKCSLCDKEDQQIYTVATGAEIPAPAVPNRWAIFVYSPNNRQIICDDHIALQVEGGVVRKRKL